ILPTVSSSSLISRAPLRLLVPLKNMCSRKCASPFSRSFSYREPVPVITTTVAVAVCGIGTSATRRPFFKVWMSHFIFQSIVPFALLHKRLRHVIFTQMTINEIRTKYLEFFKAHGHTIIPSAPIVPQNDPTTLFTGSGMQPLITYLLGAPHPKGSRLVNSQKCFRAEDIEEVGDNRHTTFFEMLGNWSLGDYFKKEQLPWFFEFLTEEIGLDPKNLYVTAFIGDEKNTVPRDTESAEILKKLFSEKGIESRIVDVSSSTPPKVPPLKRGEGEPKIFYYDAKK